MLKRWTLSDVSRVPGTSGRLSNQTAPTVPTLGLQPAPTAAYRSCFPILFLSLSSVRLKLPSNCQRFDLVVLLRQTAHNGKVDVASCPPLSAAFTTQSIRDVKPLKIFTQLDFQLDK